MSKIEPSPPKERGKFKKGGSKYNLYSTQAWVRFDLGRLQLKPETKIKFGLNEFQANQSALTLKYNRIGLILFDKSV